MFHSKAQILCEKFNTCHWISYLLCIRRINRIRISNFDSMSKEIMAKNATKPTLKAIPRHRISLPVNFQFKQLLNWSLSILWLSIEISLGVSPFTKLNFYIEIICFFLFALYWPEIENKLQFQLNDHELEFQKNNASSFIFQKFAIFLLYLQKTEHVLLIKSERKGAHALDTRFNAE